jgi:hypothetical protein
LNWEPHRPSSSMEKRDTGHMLSQSIMTIMWSSASDPEWLHTYLKQAVRGNLFGVTYDTANRDLKRMSNLGILKREG